ncbi:MAG: radical SAM family heme chaperone HemW [Planctomycetales bacterium]|nr:radical SAM family heme chaperone HemW [Planctomycetales bacterium]
MTTNSRFAPPRAAYIHVPFCRHRCGYCNFTLIAGRDDLVDTYLRAIERELSWLGSPREVDTLFIGGGTPTHLSLPQLQLLCDIVTRWFPLVSGHEFSVEANPLDLTPEKAELLASFGVNRMSLGIQSFASAKLELLERDHRAEQIASAFAAARHTMSSVSLDLIFGAPGETVESWRHDLKQALSLSPDHVSTYGLTFERGTRFWSRLQKEEIAQVAEEDERRMYLTGIDCLTQAGFEHYEVSNFARPSHRCRHNETYWAGNTYYAAGPGAARYVDGRREMNHRSTTTYLNRVLADQSPIAESETLIPEDSARERLVFGLRRLEGVDRARFQAETGFEVEKLVGQPLVEFVNRGLLEATESRIRLTREGLLVSDAIWPEFLCR